MDTVSPVNKRRNEIRAWFDSCDPTTTQTKDALKRAAKMIWQRQTHAEQESATTTDHNNIGYGRYDAKFAFRIVHWNGTLTNQLAMAARKMLRKYARQLAEIKLSEETVNV